MRDEAWGICEASGDWEVICDVFVALNGGGLVKGPAERSRMHWAIVGWKRPPWGL